MRNSREVNSNSGRIKCSSYPSLSTDEGPPNNPSSSSHFLHLSKPSDELGQSHLSTFSIRGYAFSNRTKNIQKSWPFSSTSLQLCLKHGLSDPLPPIQPLVPMISHPPEASSSKKPTLTHVEATSCKRKLKRLASNDHASAETKQGLENGSKSKTQVTILNKTPRKKCGLVVKPRACVEKEDQGCLFSASDQSMALRTCPICKTFSSASNTTLNAHIDQCLFVDLGEQPVSKPNKPRSKPRLKVKTMVDIYASAKGCTLEDLDRRNGTKWAVISSYSNRVIVCDNNKSEVSNKEKKLDEDGDAGIGPVYIDAKGQKLRIISEVKEKAADPSREHEKKTVSEGKRSYKSCKKRLEGNASEIQEYRRECSEECRGMETPGTSQRRRMLRKHSLSRNESKKGRSMCDQPSENVHSLSEDPLVLRGPSHVSTDLSEAVNSQSCGDSQVSGKSTNFAAPKPVDKGVMKLKKAWRFDVSENEDEDSGRWESEMTQERELADWDEDEETDKVFLSLSPSTSGEDNDYESWKETGNNKGDCDMLEKTDDVEVEFESMVLEKSGFETEERGSSFMEVDPIPIPGPPGSFLESPWDMEADATAAENHGNFFQVQTSFDQLDLADRNLSESPVSAVSNFAAPETQTFSLHNIITTDKRPSGFSANDQSCFCQRKENAGEDTTFSQPPPHMIHQDLLSKSVPSNSGPVLRLMGKDLMVMNQREETSRGDSSLKPTSQFQDVSKTQQVSPHAHHHRPFGGNGLYLDASTSFYIP
ncbi:uncharacterized protein LOC111198016 [Brassica napus]|uniref:uncharacterized protein LOC111198016 n=1 Tax=Brassica napus TaxID=3708 RepID=UPI00207995E9|nr:uncharacterized protein LOC111198016 [Brassica napus]XP_048608266.1 uncharacterized protein LOC111198016 [Brassica napus]